MGNMRFPRQSRAVAHMNGNPLRTQVPASARYAAPPAGFCVAFLMKPREREREREQQLSFLQPRIPSRGEVICQR